MISGDIDCNTLTLCMSQKMVIQVACRAKLIGLALSASSSMAWHEVR